MTENKDEQERKVSSQEENITIIEKNFHRTNLRRLIDTLYLFIPIAFAFAGCFLAEPFWKKITNNSETPQIFRFGCAIVLFLIAITFVFIKTRKINPIIKIGIFSKKNSEDLSDD